MKSVKPSYKEGDKFELTCEATGVPAPVVTWYKDGTMYTRNGHRSGQLIRPGEYYYKITFTGVDISDEGKYMCNVSNAYGWLSYTYTIDVTRKYSCCFVIIYLFIYLFVSFLPSCLFSFLLTFFLFFSFFLSFFSYLFCTRK